MKTKLFFTLALGLTTSLVMANVSEIPSAVLERHSKACPAFTDPERGEYMVKEAHQLPAGEYSPKGQMLYILGCDLYAYNSMEKAYLVDAYGEIINVALPEIMTDGSISATTELMGVGFDLETLTLGTYQKGRGMGDCGSAYSYKFSTYSQRFVLTEARVKDSCDGEDSQWPVIYKK